MPRAKGTAIARTIHTTRTALEDTHSGSGTNARTNAASFGQITPSRRSGQAAAAATSTESHVFSLGLVSPNSATTAHPNSADTMRPTDRVRSARSD